MNNVPNIKDIDATVLAGPVREAVGSPSAEISHWEHTPISYVNTEESNLGLHRFEGRTHDKGAARPWSIVLKAVYAPVNETDPTHWNYHRREILAYQSHLLTDLPGGLEAPRCLGVTEYPEGVCWLWLEDLVDAASLPWSLAEYGLAARHLGQFNGAYAAGLSLPDLPWLSRNWLQGWLNYSEADSRDTLGLIRDERFWENPLLRNAFPQPVTDDILRLWTSYPALLAGLDQLPQTFCHMDAYRPNLLIRRADRGAAHTVAIDWVFAGIGGIGEEIANLLAASLIWSEYDATQVKSLDKVIFAAYLDGLREAGWQGDTRLVRLGYTSACALRWGLVGLWWMKSLGDADKQAELEQHWNHPLPELVSQWAQTTYHVLGLAQEAYQLQRALF